MPKANIIIIDDKPENIKLLRKILQNSDYFVRAMTDPALALESISAQLPDLILLDISMPEMSGFEVCRILKETPKTAAIPIIFISAKIELKDKIEAFSLGGVDYITKPFHEIEVLARSGAHLDLARSRNILQTKNLELTREISLRRAAEKEQRRLIQELGRVAVTDRLTGLYNRVKLDETMTGEYDRAQRNGNPFAMILLDIDHFKKINDNHGHPAGDAVLIKLAQILTHTIRKTDIVGRWGGEEFLIISPETDGPGAANLAGKLRMSIESNVFPAVGRVTGSFGVASYQQGDTITRMIERTDQALYAAKEKGRNRVEMEGLI
jgi:diguanylate cyclase (GGDEF)-like protein